MNLYMKLNVHSSNVKQVMVSARSGACGKRFDFVVSDRYSYEKLHIASLVQRDGLISALVPTSSPRRLM